MLWYKAWHESKTRFFYTFFGVLVLSGFLVLTYESWHVPARINFNGFVWHVLYFRFFHAAWVFSTLFLALGGLESERHRGTVLFTLSLPVRRWRMLIVRAALGSAQAAIVAIAPAACVPLFALMTGHSYPLLQSLQFAALLVAGGIVFFGLGLLLSTALKGDWAPLAIGIPMVCGIYTGTRSTYVLRPYNPQDLFSGAAIVHPPDWALTAPLPWIAIAGGLAIALALLVVSIVTVEKLEF